MVAIGGCGAIASRAPAGRGVVRVTRPIRVLIVDDHRVLVDGLRVLLGHYPDLEVVGDAASVAEAAAAVEACRPDLVLMDYHLPDGDGVGATTAIRDRHPDVAVLFLSAEETDAAVFRAVEAGAVGYLLKTETIDQLADAVRRAAAGEMLFPQHLLSRGIQQQRRRAVDERRRERLRDALTPRELEILGLMAAGMSNQEISARLCISYLTVRGHVRGILGKLDCHTMLAAVVRANEYGILPPPADGRGGP